MGRPSWRWGVVAALLAALLALPRLAGLLPAQTGTALTPDALLALVRAGDAVPWSGYAEVRGDLDLPDVRELSSVPATIGETSRLRAWWRGPREFRVDELGLTGETDVVRAPGRAYVTTRSGAVRTVDGVDTRTTWDSGERTLDRVLGDALVRLPVAADLLPPALAARLARSDGVVASRVPDRRVAGRPAAGLRLVPGDPATSTVAAVDVWVDPDSGLPLQVEVLADGQDRPSLSALVLDLSLGAPPVERTRFTPPADATVTSGSAPDLAEIADREARYALPASLAGLPRRDRVAGLGGGVATYGEGLTALTLVPLTPGVAGDVRRRVVNAQPAAARGATAAAVATPLLQVLLSVQRDRGYLLAGPVPEPVLQRALDELLRDPPPEVFR